MLMKFFHLVSEMLEVTNSQSTSKINDQFWASCRLFEKLCNRMLNSIHSQPIPPVYQRRSAWGGIDKVLKEVRFLVVYPLNTTLGNDTTSIGLE